MAFEGWRTWWDSRRKVGKVWREGLQKIRADLDGIEKPVGVWLFRLKSLILTELIQLVVWNWKDEPKWQERLPVVYVVAVTVLLVILLAWFPSAWIAAYFLGSIIVYLLNVVLLDHKVFGAPRSPERSLILFIINIAQVVLIFAIFYRWKIPNLGAPDALIDAVLIFGTVSLPDQINMEARSIAAIQVATDFILLAVFLAHIVGGIGRGEKTPFALWAGLDSSRSKSTPLLQTSPTPRWVLFGRGCLAPRRRPSQ
jgi:hypothetical protein